MKRRFLLALPFCGLLTLVTLAPPPAHAQEKVKVRFGVLTTGSQAAFYVGVKQGIYAKYGFGVEVRSLQTGVQANQALAANQVD